MDELDRLIINELQDGIPITPHPFAEIASVAGVTEEEIVSRIGQLLERKILSRFGPMYNAERLGGGLTLAAMKIPQEDFEQVAEALDELPEVAHNYERQHELNMWFVLATETPEQIAATIETIEKNTGYPVYNMPKHQEYFIGLKLEV